MASSWLPRSVHLVDLTCVRTPSRCGSSSSTWAGYGPLFVAQEKGLFAREGVEVELINNEVHAAAFGGLFSGQVDAVAGALSDAPAFPGRMKNPWCACSRWTTRGVAMAS